MNTQQILNVVANAPHDAKAFIDLAGNGKDLTAVTAVEVRDGKLVIIGSATVTADGASTARFAAAPVIAPAPAGFTSTATIETSPVPAPIIMTSRRQRRAATPPPPPVAPPSEEINLE